MNFKIQSKLTLSHIIVTLLTILLLTLFSVTGYWLYVNSNIAARYMGEETVAIADEFVGFLAGRPITASLARAYIEESDFVPLFDTFATKSKRDSYYDDWLIITDIENNILASNDRTRFNESTPFHELSGVETDMDPAGLYYAVDGDAHIGIVSIIDDRSEVMGWMYYRISEVGGFYLSPEAIFSLSLILVGAGIIATIISGFVSWFVARIFSGQLYKIRQGAAAFAAGRLEKRIEIKADDEIGDVARQFNFMADQLEQQMIQLREFGDKNALLAEEASALASLEERNRLARELHDAVKQELFGLNLTAGSIRQLIDRDPELAKERLGQLEQQTQIIVDEMDQIIKQLRPVSLEKKGLVVALRELVKLWGERNKIDVTLMIQSEFTIPLIREHTLYRIAQEALTNIAKHANAAKVKIDLLYELDALTLIIEDDGQGFDPTISRPSQSLGLTSMKERAEELGGKFALKSTAGAGTILEVCIPLLKDERYG